MATLVASCAVLGILHIFSAEQSIPMISIPAEMIIFIQTTACRDRQTKETIQSIQQSKYKSTKNVPD